VDLYSLTIAAGDVVDVFFNPQGLMMLKKNIMDIHGYSWIFMDIH
jgi:peroxiredoxin family protein